MATEQQRKWTLVRTRRGRFETHGPEVKPGESVPVVEAVLSPETVEKVARAWAEEIGGGGLFAPDAEFPGEAERNTVFRQGLLRDTRVLLRAAGFVSEPSAGGDDATD